MQWFRRPERHASQAPHVSPFGLMATRWPGRQPLTSRPTPACRLVSHDESAEVDLAEIGGVQVTSADAAQVNVHEHLILAGRRHRPALEASLAIVRQHHRQHLARTASACFVSH